MQSNIQSRQILSRNLSKADTIVRPQSPGHRTKSRVIVTRLRSCQYPFCPPFDEFVEHDADVVDHKSTNIESKKFGCVLNTELKPKVRLRRMLQSRIFHLSSNLICMHLSVKPCLDHRGSLRIMVHTQNLNGIAELRKRCHVIRVWTTILHLAEFSLRKFGICFVGHG